VSMVQAGTLVVRGSTMEGCPSEDRSLHVHVPSLQVARTV
jgi:hypothetical protein